MAKRITEIGGIKLEPVELEVAGQKRVFDIGDPVLPDWIKDNALTSGSYPYSKKLDEKLYLKQLEDLQEELVKLQGWLQTSGERVMILFEGRDAAGKGGTINAFRENLNPRSARNVALSKPTDAERAQWYFQRYVTHFPTAGEIVTFDRSWYNRAVVEPVMGFCTPEQYAKFLLDVPHFEQMIVDEGIHFFKIWLNVGQEMQLLRFHDRAHSRLKHWKFSPIDIKGMTRWSAYSEHRDRMLAASNTEFAPWTVVRANDKRRARLEVIRHVLESVNYKGKSAKKVGSADKSLIISGSEIPGAGK